MSEGDELYGLDSDFSILVLDAGDKVTIEDALNYLGIKLYILPEKNPDQDVSGNESAEEPKDEEEASMDSDDPTLPKVKISSSFFKIL